MSGATSVLRRAAAAIGRAVASAGVVAASAPSFGLPSGPPIAECWPDVVWVVLTVSDAGRVVDVTAWVTPEAAGEEKDRIRNSLSVPLSWGTSVHRCTARP